jgi:hypothetical protein
MSLTCKALEEATEDSNSVSKCLIDKTLNVKVYNKNEEQGEGVVDDYDDDSSDSPEPDSPILIAKDRLINSSKDNINSSTPVNKNQKRKMMKTDYDFDDDSNPSTQESSDDNSNSPKPFIRKRKFGLSRIKKIRKLLKSTKQSQPSKPSSTNLFTKYGITPSYSSGGNIVRRIIALGNSTHFAPK